MTCGVYLITCIPTQEKYVGSSVNIERRWTQHKAQLNRQERHNPKFQSAWNDYGRDKFIMAVLETTEENVRISKERLWFDKIQPELNIMVPSETFQGWTFTEDSRAKLGGGFRGKHHTEESKRKMSKNLVGRKQSAEGVEKRAIQRRGVKQPIEWIIKRIETRKSNGKKWTAESRKKTSLSHIGKSHPCSQETKEKLRSKGLERWTREEREAASIRATGKKRGPYKKKSPDCGELSKLE